MSIDLWLYDISNPHSEFSNNALPMKMRDFSLAMRLKILADILNVDADELVFAKSANGKPYLESDDSLSFNVSHTGTLWGMAVSLDGAGVGLDIETRRERKYMNKMIEEYFHPKEFDHYSSLPDKQSRTDCFCKLWTQKEAYAKYLGQGLRYDFSSDAFLVEALKEVNIISGCISSLKSKNHKVYLSLAYPTQTPPQKLTFFGDTSLNIQMMS